MKKFHVGVVSRDLPSTSRWTAFLSSVIYMVVMRKNTPPKIPTNGQTRRLYIRLRKFQSWVLGLDERMASDIWGNGEGELKTRGKNPQRLQRAKKKKKEKDFSPLLAGRDSQRHQGDDQR